MHVEIASAPGTAGAPNEDLVLATPRIVVVADGAGVPAEFDTGCIHSTAWYVSQLVTQIAVCEASAPTADLRSILAEALTTVASAHADTCELTADGTPSATVAILRVGTEELDYRSIRRDDRLGHGFGDPGRFRRPHCGVVRRPAASGQGSTGRNARA